MFLAQRDAAFVLVVRLDLEPDEIRRRALYWLRFIRACAASDASETRPWVLLVGSRARAPTLEAGEAPRRLRDLVDELTPLFAASLELSVESKDFALDCRLGPAKQEGMRKLVRTLASRHRAALKGAVSPRLCELVRDQLPLWVNEGQTGRTTTPLKTGNPFWTIEQIADRLVDGPMAGKAAEIRADDHSLVHTAMRYLHDEGDVVYELGEAEELREYVIINPQWFCGSLLASLTVPPSLARARGQIEPVEADDNGTVALDAMRERFPHFADPRTLMTMLEVRAVIPSLPPSVHVSTFGTNHRIAVLRHVLPSWSG